MSCLLQISNTPITLNEILNEDQLIKLLQMAVWCENGKSMCGGKWTSHAITCLLQDIMDSKKLFFMICINKISKQGRIQLVRSQNSVFRNTEKPSCCTSSS